MLQMPIEGRARAPFWQTALLLWAAGLLGAVLILPYVTTLEAKVLAAAAAHLHKSVWVIVGISTAQTGVLLLIAVLAGLWAARKLDLATPLIDALLLRQRLPPRTGVTLLLAAAVGAAMGLLLIALDKFVFAPIPSVAGLIAKAGPGAGPNAWQGLLASFYGALDEEILMRLGVMSLLALLLRTLVRAAGRSRAPLPSGVFWTANLAAAILFGLGHLPATAALAPLTTALVIRAVVLNGSVGIVFGALFRRYGLEWAMISHFAADLILHVAGA
jgi:hypothetical protein